MFLETRRTDLRRFLRDLRVLLRRLLRNFEPAAIFDIPLFIGINK